MINPNRVHRSKAIVTEFTQNRGTYLVRLAKTGALIDGYDLPKNIEIGDLVNIQARFSIMADRYIVQSINKAKGYVK